MSDSFTIETLCSKDQGYSKRMSLSKVFIVFYSKVCTAEKRNGLFKKHQTLHTTPSYLKCLFHNFRILEMGVKCHP